VVRTEASKLIDSNRERHHGRPGPSFGSQGIRAGPDLLRASKNWPGSRVCRRDGRTGLSTASQSTRTAGASTSSGSGEFASGDSLFNIISLCGLDSHSDAGVCSCKSSIRNVLETMVTSVQDSIELRSYFSDASVDPTNGTSLA
jgi:hypothetical protein